MTSKELITQLYVGYFDRAPDPVGLTFWIDVLDNGMSLEAIAQDFSTQPEAQNTYAYLDALIPPGPATGGSDIQAFINAIYDNLFSRAPDAPGLAFWTGVLNNGYPPGSFIHAIIEGASTADAAILANKVDVATEWADDAANESGFTLSQAYIDASGNALGAVTADATTVAAGKSASDLFFQDGPSLALQNTTTTLPENTSTATRVKVADIVITDDGIGTNTLSLSGADAAMFEIDGMELFLKAGTTLDFETVTSLDVTVEVDDAAFGTTPDDTASLTIAVSDVNEAPGIALANAVTTLAESASTATRIKVADIVITDDAMGTNNASLSGADAAMFEIDGTELFLKAGATLDFETNPALDVTVEVDDATIGTTPDDTSPLTIAVSDVNEAPGIALANAVTTLAESASTATRIKVADIVITDDAMGTNNASLSGADAAMFEIDGTELFLKAGATLDFATNPALDVTVEVDDATIGTTPDDTASLSIAVSDVNQAPSVSLANMVTLLAEDTNTATRIKMADIVITDDAMGTNTLSLSDTDAALFEIDGTELFLKAGATLDFETSATLNVSVDVNDVMVGTSPDDSASLSLTITDANEAPSVMATAISAGISENANTATRIKMADIVITDDAMGTNTLSLSGADAAMFEIDGMELFLKAGATLDYTTNPSLDVTIEVNDASLGTTDGVDLSIPVGDVNLAPTVTLLNADTTIHEGTVLNSSQTVATIVVNDDGSGTNNLSLSGADAALFEIVGNHLRLKAGTTLDATGNPTLDVMVEVDDTSIGFGPEDTAALAIAVTPGVPGLASDSTEVITLTGGATSTVRVGQIEVPDVDPSTPGNQPGFLLHEDPSGMPYAGVAGAILNTIDTSGHDGLVSLGVFSKADPDGFTLNNAGSSGDVELCLGEGNVFGVATTPEVSATGTWAFLNAGSTGQMSVEIKALNVASGATLDFDNVTIVVSGDVDLSDATLLIDANCTIEVQAGATLTLSVEQVDDLEGASINIYGAGTVAVTGENDDSDVAADTTFSNLNTAQIDLSDVTIGSGDSDSAMLINVTGAEDGAGVPLTDGSGNRVAQTVIGSAGRDLINIASGDDGDAATLDVILRLGGDGGDAQNPTLTNQVPFGFGVDEDISENPGDVILKTVNANIRVEVDDDFDQVAGAVDSYLVESGQKLHAVTEGNFTATAATVNDGTATIEVFSPGAATIDMTLAGGSNGWHMIGRDDVIAAQDSFVGSAQDDVMVDGTALGNDNDGEEDVFQGNAGADKFVFNTAFSTPAMVSYSTEAEARDYASVDVNYTDAADDATDQLNVWYQHGPLAPLSLIFVNETTVPGVDFTDSNSIANAIATLLNAEAGVTAMVDPLNLDSVVAYGTNGVAFNFTSIVPGGPGMNPVGMGGFILSNQVDIDHSNDAADQYDDDRGQVSATLSAGTIDPGETYVATVTHGYVSNAPVSASYTAQPGDTANDVMNALAATLNAASLGKFTAGSPGTPMGIMPAPAPGELVIRDVDANDGGVSLTVVGLSALTGHSASSVLTGAEAALADADADVILDFTSGDDSIDFDGLAAGSGANYAEAAAAASFTAAHTAADAALGGGVIYYFTSTATDGGLLFVDADGDGSADGLVSLPGIDSTGFAASDIV